MVRTALYAKLTDEEIKIVDSIVEKLDYETRTDFITAIMHTIIYGDRTTETLPEIEAFSACIENLETLQAAFFTVLDEYAFPVLARLGPDAAYKALKDDLASWMYDRCKTVPDTEQMKTWIHAFHAARRTRIIQYKTKLMTDNYREEHGIDDQTPETAHTAEA